MLAPDRMIRVLGLPIMVAGFCTTVEPQTLVSAASVFREQFNSMAGEVVDKLELNGPGRVRVLIEGSKTKTSAENAFIEALSRRGFHATVASGEEGDNVKLRVLVLDQSVSYRGLPAGSFQRTSRTFLEARVEREQGISVSVLGTFSREGVDTVMSRDTELDLGEDDHGGVLDQLFGPLAVIIASLTIVYLLFTVRS